jgi:hypothetical protein
MEHMQTKCYRCWKRNVDVHTCNPTDVARWYEIWEMVKALWEYWVKHPELRFWQLLFAIWYLESDDSNDWVQEGKAIIKDPFYKNDSKLQECLDKAK